MMQSAQATDCPEGHKGQSKPEHRSQPAIAEAIRWLADRADDQPALAEAAAVAGMSPFHFQRAFSTAVGVSPARFVRNLKAERAKDLLISNRPVLDAALEAGLSGPGRLHDLMVTFEAMTPGDYARRGAALTLTWGLATLPLGTAFILMSDRGVCGLTLLDPVTVEQALDGARRLWSLSAFRRDDAAVQAVADHAFDPGRTDGPLRLMVRGTNFQIQVWRALLAIPEGCLSSYGQLARAVGRPGAARAVGGAVGANPVAVLIPCHRVVRETGRLGGYAGGLSWKRRLIALEASRQSAADADGATEEPAEN